eukprot:gene6692-10857_t
MSNNQLRDDVTFGIIWFIMFVIFVCISGLLIVIVFVSVVYPSQQYMNEFTPTTCKVLNNTCIQNTTFMNTTNCYAFIQYGEPKNNFEPILIKLSNPMREINSTFICYYKHMNGNVRILQKDLAQWDTFRFLVFSFFTGGLLFDCIISLILISIMYGLVKAFKSINWFYKKI